MPAEMRIGCQVAGFTNVSLQLYPACIHSSASSTVQPAYGVSTALHSGILHPAHGVSFYSGAWIEDNTAAHAMIHVIAKATVTAEHAGPQ